MILSSSYSSFSKTKMQYAGKKESRMYALRIIDKVIKDDFIGMYRYDTVEEAEKAGEELVEKYTENEVEYKVIAV
jgi:hypothetical protein